MARCRRGRDEPQQEHLADPARARRQRRDMPLHRDRPAGRLPFRGAGRAARRRGGADHCLDPFASRRSSLGRGCAGADAGRPSAPRACDCRRGGRPGPRCDHRRPSGEAEPSRPGRSQGSGSPPYDLGPRFSEPLRPRGSRLGRHRALGDGAGRVVGGPELPGPGRREREAPAPTARARFSGEPLRRVTRQAAALEPRGSGRRRLVRHDGRATRPRGANPNRCHGPGRAQR